MASSSLDKLWMTVILQLLFTRNIKNEKGFITAF
jgi:hypothetical protein